MKYQVKAKAYQEIIRQINATVQLGREGSWPFLQHMQQAAMLMII